MRIILRESCGFTLLELMVVVMMVGVMAAIAIPSYSSYIRTAARADAESQMLKLASDLERWRSKNLSYAGFVPDVGFATTAGSLTSATNATLYIPKGSTSTNYKYQLAILDGANRANSLATNTLTTGQQWIIIAQPRTTNAVLSLASRLILSSQGVQCLTNTALTDAQMKLNIADTTISDAALCVDTSQAW